MVGLLGSLGLAILSASVASAATLSKRLDITDFATSPIGITYPPDRDGFNATWAYQGPCGMRPAGSRTNFPISGGKLVFESISLEANMEIMYYAGYNPVAVHGFSTYTNTVLVISPGTYCTTAPDFGSLGFKVGDNAVIMASYQIYGETQASYYTCADLTLVENSAYTMPTDVTCANTSTVLMVDSSSNSLNTGSGSGEKVDGQTVQIYAATQTVSVSASASTSAAAAASSKSGMSAAAGGGIGAALGIVICGLLLGTAFIAGYIHLGKKDRPRSGAGLHKFQAPDDAASITSSTFPLRQMKT